MMWLPDESNKPALLNYLSRFGFMFGIGLLFREFAKSTETEEDKTVS
jgi:hypothetical protein